MAKKLFELSAQGKQARKKGKNSLISMSLAEAKMALNKQPHLLKEVADEDIDFSDIPELTDRDLKNARRVGRPLLGFSPRKLISIKIDPDLLKKLKSKAIKYGKGYQTFIHEILEQYMKKRAV